MERRANELEYFLFPPQALDPEANLIPAEESFVPLRKLGKKENWKNLGAIDLNLLKSIVKADLTSVGRFRLFFNALEGCSQCMCNMWRVFPLSLS